MTESIRERSASSDVSAETLEVLEKIRRPGDTFEGVDPKPAEPTDPKPPVEEKKPVEPKEKSKPTEKKDDEPSDDEDGEVEEKDKKEPSKPDTRPARSVPVKKFNEQRHELGETKAKLAKAEADLALALKGVSDKPNKEEVDDVRAIAKSLAEKHGFDEEFVAELMDKATELATKKAGKQTNIPEDLAQTIASLKARDAQAQEAEKARQEDKWFEDSFSEVSTEFPELADPKVKEELKQLAFMEGYESAPLRAIALEWIHDNKPRKTVEEPGKGRAEVTDFENVTEEQLKKMSRAEQAKYLEWQKNTHDYRTNANR